MIQTGTPFLWEQLLQVPFAQRLAPAPDEIVNFIAAYNAAHGSPLQASAAVPDEHFVADLAAAIETLPAAVTAHLEPRLLGIFFMRGLVSSAVTDLLTYANGDILGAFVVVDVDAFAQTRANAWLSWRERTAFEARDGYRVEVEIAAGEDDTRQAALQYILLHEFGHVLASASSFMPDWWLPRIEALPPAEKSFAALSWALQADASMRPHPHDDFPLRDRIVLYATPRLDGTQMPAIYADLARTAFPTLYAASDVHEDFAECFATYVHCVLLGKPYALSVFEGEQLQARYEGFWREERAAPKARFLAALLARAPEHFPRYPIHREAHLLCADILQRAASEFLGLAPLLRLNLDSGDLRHVARTLLAQTGADQDNAILWMNLATAFFAVGERELGLAMQAQALLLQRQYTLTAAVQPVQMRVLMLMAPGDLAENTPLDCLLEGSPVDFVLYYVSEAAPLPQPLPPHDVLLVGLSQTDSNHAVLQALAGLLADWPRPVVNRPEAIPNVERSTASQLLQDVPGLLMPPTASATREALAQVAAGSLPLAALLPEAEFPIILRPLGSHAGRDLRKLDHAASIADYLAAVPDADFYLSRFIDYSGADGQFRKYRVALIDGVPYACHMAISDDWMIHYVNAGMYVDAAKRAEEAAFMDSFGDFVRRHQAALAAIHARCGLDYIGIDCAETRAGELLIFEVDHAMVVHAMDPVDLFPYKAAHMRKARLAFERLLSERIAGQRPR